MRVLFVKKCCSELTDSMMHLILNPSDSAIPPAWTCRLCNDRILSVSTVR